MKKIRTILFALIACLSAGVTASAAALDTTKLADITTSMDNASSWLSGSVTTAIIALIVAALIIAIAKFAGKKARP